MPKAVIERIMCRAPRVSQRTANDGRERAATVTRSAEQVQRQKALASSQARALLVDWWSGAGRTADLPLSGSRTTCTLPLTKRKVAHARPVAQSAIRVLTHLTSRPQTAGLGR